MIWQDASTTLPKPNKTVLAEINCDLALVFYNDEAKAWCFSYDDEEVRTPPDWWCYVEGPTMWQNRVHL